MYLRRRKIIKTKVPGGFFQQGTRFNRPKRKAKRIRIKKPEKHPTRDYNTYTETIKTLENGS